MTSEWGRVDESGTVYVRTADGERSVGQYPEGSPDEALAFFTQRFESLATEVGLLEQRVRGGALSPDEAAKRIKEERTRVAEANAVGDLGGLVGRLDSLGPVIAAQRTQRKAEKAKQAEVTREAKEKVIAEAESIGSGTDWRHGSARLQKLLVQWKELPRLDKAADDALWKRFSAARSAYTKRRKVWFAEQDQAREGARVVKTKLVAEAESVSSSTDWGPTARKYRDLMQNWKAAGRASKEVDDELWARFRGAQDIFFAARDAANAELDKEYAANAEVKDKILLEAEALLPVTDLAAAKRAMRSIAERWDEAGKVPRDRKNEMEGRFAAVEKQIRALDEEKWTRSDPEKSARANDMVAKLQAAVDDLEAQRAKAEESGDDKRAKSLERDLESRRAFLEAAQKASADFS